MRPPPRRSPRPVARARRSSDPEPAAAMNRRRWPMCLGVTLVVVLAAFAARAAEPDPDLTLDVTFDPGASRVTGHARVRVVNRTARALPDVALWLYPNHLATRLRALTDVSYHWLYPGW